MSKRDCTESVLHNGIKLSSRTTGGISLLAGVAPGPRTPEWLAKQYAGAFADIRVTVQGADSGTDGERRQKFQEILEYLIRGARRTAKEDNVLDLPA